MKNKDFFFKSYREKIKELKNNQGNDLFEEEIMFGEKVNRNSSSPWRDSRKSPSRRAIQREPYKNVENRKRSLSGKKEDYQEVWEHLYTEGLRNNKKIEETYKENKHKIDNECTFQPTIRKTVRYEGNKSSNFLERNCFWLENKMEKLIREKEGETVKGLEECTFKPKLNKYKKPIPSHYHHLLSIKSHSRAKTEHEINVSERIRRKKHSLVDPENNKPQEVGRMKDAIRNELRKISLV